MNQKEVIPIKGELDAFADEALASPWKVEPARRLTTLAVKAIQPTSKAALVIVAYVFRTRLGFTHLKAVGQPEPL